MQSHKHSNYIYYHRNNGANQAQPGSNEAYEFDSFRDIVDGSQSTFHWLNVI